MTKYSWLLFFLGIVSISSLMAQNSPADMTGKVLINSPNAAVFTQYGKVPVSLFTGIPDIRVPLYDIKVDNFTMPIYLSYYARGIQPNSHAGWVGTGWNLFAGSVITRKINGAPDEWVIPYPFGSYTAGTQIGWYYQHSSLNNTNWSSIDSLLNYSGGIEIGTTAVRDAAPDEFDFNLNGISGAFFLGEDGNWKIRANEAENIKVQVIAPGLYNFASNPTIPENAPTSVGNTFTQIILTTGDGTIYSFGGDPYSIEFNRAGLWYTPYNTNTLAMAWHLKQITLPSGKTIVFQYFRNGNQYVYNPDTRGGFYQLTSGPTMPNWFTAFNNNSLSVTSANLVANDVNVNITDPVYLQSISFPEGKLVFNSAPSGEVDVLDPPFNYFCDQSTSCGLSYPGAYTFNALLSNYSFQIDPQGNGSQQLPPSTWFQLNDIEQDDFNGNKIKDIKLAYLADKSPSARLLLNSVQTFGYYNNSTGVSMPPYSFVYDTAIHLPGYCSQQVDHWGFYDGPASINPFPSIALDATGFPNATGQTNYYNYREPNTNYTQAEILTQINYPSGGSTQFQYEPNQYISWVGSFPPTVTQLSQPAIGGGVRIKQIISQANPSAIPVTYQYSYVTDLVSNKSSGVLGMPRPAYFETNSLSLNSGQAGLLLPVNTYVNVVYKYWNSTSVFPSQNDDGNIVTYTNVIERQSSNGVYNGMKITQFSNHDNGYKNFPPDAAIWTASVSTELYHYNDLGFERGLVLSEKYLDASNDTLRKILYSYNSDTTRFVKCILSDSRVLSLTAQVPSAPTGDNGFYSDPDFSATSTTANLNFFRTSAIRFYTFYPALKQTVETDYPTDLTANPIVTTSNYSYDAVYGTRNMIKKTVNDSKGELVITNTQYPLNFPSTVFTDPFSLGMQNIQNMNAVGIPVEKYIQKSNSDGSNLRTISSLLNAYDPLLPVPDLVNQSEIVTPLTNFLPASISNGTLSEDPSYQPKFYVDRYDNLGNTLQQHKTNDVNQSYQWGYNNEHPVAKVTNAINNYQNYNTYSPSTQSVSYTFVPNNLTGQNQSFTTFTPGTITISIGFGGNPGSNTTANVSYNLVGPTDQMGQLCTNGCTTQNSISFTNMPVGGYILTITPNINNSLANLDVTCTYPGFTTIPHISGIKEFYYEGFESNPLGVSVPANLIQGFAGTKVFYNGLFKVPFKRPDTRPYTISYFLNGQSFVGSYSVDSMTINATGMALDEIRVYPSDAQMTTYTYAPLVGMTSMNDFNNKVTYYEYEGLGRLMNIKDYQGNIIKNYQYNYVTSCGNNCYVLPMQTINGSNTIGYPVGVFNVNGQLVGIATTQATYISLWNGNSVNHAVGTLVAGADPLHFNLTVNSGATVPYAVTGCRYYQFDMAWNLMDAIRNLNGCYVDFGDGTGMHLGKSSLDTVGLVLPPNTLKNYSSVNGPYFVHTYPDSTLKTITIYHNDATESPDLDAWTYPATSLFRIKNIRGNYPQNMQLLGGTSYQLGTANSVSGITNWSSINSINTWYPYGGYSGLYLDPCRSMTYTQDFMANDINLTTIHSANGSFYTQGYADTTFKISRLKSNWNTYFTNLTAIAICDDQWNRESLGGLPQLTYFNIIAGNQNHNNISTGNPLVLIPTSAIDNIINQIAAGSGQLLSNGTIIIQSGGPTYSSASSASVTMLKSKGWSIYIDSVLQ